MNTPDTEWEKELTGNNGILIRSIIRLAGTGLFEGKGAELDKYNEWHAEALEDLITKLHTSRDTYWKERVEESYSKGFTAGMGVAEEQHTGRVLTNEDNLK